jgi:predicted aminopeptidase
VTELHLPDNPSYRRYADLQRRAVVWNVVAAPSSRSRSHLVLSGDRLRGLPGLLCRRPMPAPKPTQLQAQGWRSVYGVPAYSTLGWMNWAGGDPLLNTFITTPRANWPA